MDGLAEKGYTVISPFQKEERSGIVVFTHRSHDMGFLFQSLKKIGVAVNLRNRTIRVSPHFYNTRDEIDLLLDAL
jgi:selenocysteine lyase/cysteine desulfurase